MYNIPEQPEMDCRTEFGLRCWASASTIASSTFWQKDEKRNIYIKFAATFSYKKILTSA